MSHWHEHGCRRPDIAVIDGLPYCQYCSTLASYEAPEIGATSFLVQTRQDNIRQPLSWPDAVDYTSRDNDSAMPLFVQDETHPNKSYLPAIEFEDEIRLLQLTKRDKDDPVHFEFTKTRLRDPSFQKYDALSYTWTDEAGDSSQSHRVFYGPFWDIVYVTSNCKKALRGASSSEQSLVVWIDCLCINQSDPIEKGHQVGLMREIYMNAATVFAYLGDAAGERDSALGSLKALISSPSNPLEGTSRERFNVLFDNPIFTRLWIFGELLLARNLEFICGQHTIPWPRGLASTSLPSLMPIRESWGGIGHFDLFQLLLQTSQYECSDPRDRIFGLLGLSYESSLRANYTLPVEAVYTGITAYLIKNGANLDALALAGAGRRAFDLPSWVPDWSQKQNLRFPEDFLPSAEQMEDNNYEGLEYATSLSFNGLGEDRTILIDAEDWSLQISATKICDISLEAKLKLNDDCVHVTMLVPSTRENEERTLVASLLKCDYSIGDDSIYLLSGWDHLVILRSQPNSTAFSFIAVCSLSLAFPLGWWFMPSVSDETSDDRPRTAKFSELIAEEKSEVHEFDLALSDFIYKVQSPEDGLVRVLGYCALALTELKYVEAKLRGEWDKLDQSIGWMFLDKAAVRALINHLTHSDTEFEKGGKGEIEVAEERRFEFRQCAGVDLDLTYEWNLLNFCQSWLAPSSQSQPSNNNNNKNAEEEMEEAEGEDSQAEAPSSWTPTAHELQKHISEIQEWAKLTAQLLLLFTYSHRVLGPAWSPLPSSRLPASWALHCSSFASASSPTAPTTSRTTSTSVVVAVPWLWQWPDFRNALAARQRLWALHLPRRIQPRASYNVAVRLGLRAVLMGSGEGQGTMGSEGRALVTWERITIV